MSDPISTACVLKQQRDEWKRKYEEEVELWEWIKANTADIYYDEYGPGFEVVGPEDANGLAKVLACDPDPREAVRKAMEQSRILHDERQAKRELDINEILAEYREAKQR